MEYFKDQWFYKAKKHVINTITQEEYRLYKEEKIRKIYDSFEFMLLDNIEYYDRIIRTIIWLYDNILVSKGKVIDKIDKDRYIRQMTPTKFYYLIMIDIESTRDEIIFAYDTLSNKPGETFVELYPYLKKINAFAFNISFLRGQYNSKSFQKLLELDKTDSKFLESILCEINKDSININPSSLMESLETTAITYENMIEVYNIITSELKESDICDVKPTKISVFDKLSEYRCAFEDGIINRKTIKNYRGCFEYDRIFSKHLKNIYKWALNSIPSYETDIVYLMESLIKNDRSNFKAIRISPDNKFYSTLIVKKKWNYYQFFQTYYYNNVLIGTEKITASEYEIAKRIYREGYFIFGIEKEFDNLKEYSLDDTSKLLDYYMEYVYNSQLSLELILEKMQSNLIKTLNKLEIIYGNK